MFKSFENKTPPFHWNIFLKKKTKMKSALKQLKDTLKKQNVYEKLSKKQSKKDGRALVAKINKFNQERNPFEIKHTKDKHKVLNKSRAKKSNLLMKKSEGIQKRKETLGREMQEKHKIGTLIDKRFGEKNSQLSSEEKLLQRFMKEKTKKFRSENHFSLNQEDELTHMGQSLDSFAESGLEKMHSDSDDDNGMLSRETVSQMNFGGFEEKTKKSRSEIMMEVIQKSKFHKKQRQMQKENDLELMEDLDENLNDIRSLLAPMPKSEGKMTISSDRLKLIENEFPDFDKTVKELAFEKRGQPTNRIKTEEELAQEELEELEEKEKRRQRRMKGLNESDEEEVPKKKKTRPAPVATMNNNNPDLLDLPEMPGAEIAPLTYKDGKLVNTEIFMKPTSDSESSSEGSVDEASSEDDTEEESASEESSAEDNETLNHEHEEDFEGESEIDSDVSQVDIEESMRISEIQKQAAEELPYTFDMPESYEDFTDLMLSWGSSEQLEVIKRLRVQYNPKLGPSNKQKIKDLTGFLVRYLYGEIDRKKLDMGTIKGFQSHLVPMAKSNMESFIQLARIRLTRARDILNKSRKFPTDGIAFFEK